MKRGPKDIAAEVLEEVINNPRLAPTRIIARTSASYQFLKILLENGLVNIVKLGKRRGKLVVTDKGREFLKHYKICEQLFPI